MREQTAVVDGIPMRWYEHGEGQPVVFVHGVPTSPHLWRHVVGQVSDTRRLSWEMVGFGGSVPAGRGRDISLASQADYLAGWLGHLDLQRAVLVGHDLGGGVAQILATRQPDRIAGLVITNAVCYDCWPIPIMKVTQRAGTLARKLPDVALYPLFVSLLRRTHDNQAQASEAIGIHWRNYATHGAAASLVQQASALDVRDTLAVADRLPSLELPARVVWGAADQFLRVSYGERLARDLGATLDRIEGARHFTPEDHPDRIASAIRNVVQDMS